MTTFKLCNLKLSRRLNSIKCYQTSSRVPAVDWPFNHLTRLLAREHFIGVLSCTVTDRAPDFR